MRSTALLWACLTPVALAWTSLTLPQVGVNLPGPGLSEISEESFKEAGRTPNATSSITFQRVFDNQPDTWSWRVNVTELRVPNFYQELGQSLANDSEGRHLINTQWQLQWPADDSKGDHGGLLAYLRARDLTLYANFFQIDVPSEVASRYSAGSNGDCAPVLGIECVQALQNAASGNGPVYYHWIEECSSTLVGQSYGTSTGYAPPVNGTDFELDPEDTVFYSTFDTFETDSSTPLYRAEGMLQLLIIDFKDNAKNESGSMSGPSVLCQVVDKSKAGSSAFAIAPYSTASLLTIAVLCVVLSLSL